MDKGKVDILDTTVDRLRFYEALAGKRVLHVKGFGSGFKDPSESQSAQEDKQEKEAVEAMVEFNPDFLVVDGDPWGSGFQRYIKAFVDFKHGRGVIGPQLIWVKNVTESTADGGVANSEERDKRVKQAESWAEQCISVSISWFDNSEITVKMNSLFGADTWTTLKPVEFNKRGDVRILTETPPSWAMGVEPTIKDAIAAVEQRDDLQCFEKCSFENVAKGNAIFDSLHNPKCAAHGVVSFGGGESVLLEFGTVYLNSGSGFDSRSAAVFPFSRGREETDPKLPRHVGAAFTKGKGVSGTEDEVRSCMCA